MVGPLIVSAGCIAAASGVPLLWLAWTSKLDRKALARVAGWLLILGGSAFLGMAGGAWGYAVAASAASAAALLILAIIAVRSPSPRRIPTRTAPLQPFDWSSIRAQLPRRIAVFFLVVPGGLFASSILALAARAAAKQAGWAEADATMLALGGMPLFWSIIATVQMTQSSLARMTALIAIPAIAGGLLGFVA